MQSLKATATAILLVTLGSMAVSAPTAGAQTTSRTVAYHSQDIIPIRAKLKYTTLIVIPATEKIMEAATGDKDFWIVDVVGNFVSFIRRNKASARISTSSRIKETFTALP